MKAPYTRDSLIDQIDNGLSPEWLHFWGHQPSKDGSISKSCFSQWWLSEFEVEGKTYWTAEHFMMAGKARAFNDLEMESKIIGATTPAEAKQLGRKVKGFDDREWKSVRSEIVVEGNIAKFSQDPALTEFLLGTGDAVLVEASPRDRIWGIGMGAGNPSATDPKNWRGGNLLGFALMEVRKFLRSDE